MRSHGFTTLFVMLAMTALVGLTALAVDFGHIQVARFELVTACDAAARAGVQVLATPGLTASQQQTAAVNASIAIASQNTVDAQPLILDSTMVQVGNFDNTLTPNFLAGRTPYNAVEVEGYRDQAHHDALALALASAVGVTSFDISASSTATKPLPPSPYGIAGINHASYSCLGALSTLDGNLVSNGDVSVGVPLGVGITVTKDVRTFSGTLSKGNLVTVGGTYGSLSSSLYYPPVSIPKQYDNTGIAPQLDASNNYSAVGIADIPGGTYLVHDLNFLAGLVVNLQGPVTFYVTGSFNMAASINLCNVLNTTPNNLNIMVAPGGQVNILGNLIAPVAMNLYAPDSAISIAVSVNHYTGSIIGKSLDISLPAISYFTEGPPPAILASTTLVK